MGRFDVVWVWGMFREDRTLVFDLGFKIKITLYCKCDEGLLYYKRKMHMTHEA